MSLGASFRFPRKGPRSPGGGLVVRTPSIGGAENAARFAYPPSILSPLCRKTSRPPKFSRRPGLPPLLTETNRYDRFGRNSSMKSTPASPCQHEVSSSRPSLVRLAQQAKLARESARVLQENSSPAEQEPGGADVAMKHESGFASGPLVGGRCPQPRVNRRSCPMSGSCES